MTNWASLKVYGPNGKRICGFPGCGKRHNARGLCCNHDRQSSAGKEPKPPKRVPPRTGCVVEGCDGKHVSSGYCGMHYARLKRGGSPAGLRRSRAERFWERVDENGPGGCWIWTGATFPTGYGAAVGLSPVPGGTTLPTGSRMRWTEALSPKGSIWTISAGSGTA